MEIDNEGWSGEGDFTRQLVDWLAEQPAISRLRVEDAPASRTDVEYNFISNEIYVRFATRTRVERQRAWGFIPVRREVAEPLMTFDRLEAALEADPAVGAPDYADEAMIQYLHTERVIPPYQTRGYKLVELVRIYEAGDAPRAD